MVDEERDTENLQVVVVGGFVIWQSSVSVLAVEKCIVSIISGK